MSQVILPGSRLRLFAISSIAIVITGCGGGGGGGGSSPPPPNQAPTANAGADQTVVEGLTVTLSAAASSDSDGTISGYSWTQTSGASVTLQDANSATATFTAPLTDTALDLAFQLTVTDNDTATATASTNVTIDPSQPPVVDAGSDQNVIEGLSATLDATVSDADGTIANYAWVQTAGPIVTLTGADSEDASFQAPIITASTDLVFELTATDSTNDEGVDTVTVTVIPSQPPTVNAGADQEVIERDAVVLDADTDDVDGTIVNWTWAQVSGPAVTLTPTDAEDTAFTAPVVDTVTALEFQLEAMDSTDDSGVDNIVVTVNPNEPPDVAVRFPCAGCRFYGDAIAVAGSVTPGADNSFVAATDGISELTVDAGAGQITAIVQSNGQWLAQNVPMPLSSTAITLTITATDLLQESTTSTVDIGNEPTITGVLLAHDPAIQDRIYLFETANARERLFAIDLGTLGFNKLHESPQQLQNSGQVGSAYVAGTTLYMNELFGDIIAFDTSDGTKSVISGSTVGAGPLFSRTTTMALDSGANRLLVYDGDTKALFAIDIATGDRTIVSDNAGVGTGPLFDDPLEIALDTNNDIAYLTEPLGNYIAVDLGTGDRTALTTSGISVNSTSSSRFDAGRSRIVEVTIFDEVYAVDPTTGVRSQVSGMATPDLATGNAWEMTVDTLSDRYVINDFSEFFNGPDTNRLVSVDPDSGARAVIFDDSLGTGPSLNSSVSFDINDTNGLVYMASSVDDNVVQLDLSTLQRTEVSNPTIGAGPVFIAVRDIAVDAPGNRVIAVDSTRVALMAADDATGNRYVISDSAIGSGPAFVFPWAVTLDAVSGVAYVLDTSIPAIFAVDLTTGARTIVSDDTNAGGAMINPLGLAYDAFNDRLLLVEFGDGSTGSGKLKSVDLQTGDRSTVSGELTGIGTPLDAIDDVAIAALPGAAEPAFAIVAGTLGVYRIELATGNRILLAGPNTANGESIQNMHHVAYDPEAGVALVFSDNFEALFAIDAVTGDRVVVSK